MTTELNIPKGAIGFSSAPAGKEGILTIGIRHYETDPDEEASGEKTVFTHSLMVSRGGPWSEMEGVEMTSPHARTFKFADEYPNAHLEFWNIKGISAANRKKMVDSFLERARKKEPYGYTKFLLWLLDYRQNRFLSRITGKPHAHKCWRRIDFSKRYHCAQAVAQEIAPYVMDPQTGLPLIQHPQIYDPDELHDLVLQYAAKVFHFAGVRNAPEETGFIRRAK